MVQATHQPADRFLRHMALTGPEPMLFNVHRASGIYLYDAEGKAYIDGISGIGVSNAGHGNKAVVEAIREQAAAYLHTMVYGEHIQQVQVNYAEALLEELGEGFEKIYFVNSGAEAIEGVMKLAKRYTGRGKIVACKHAYHGSTQGAASLMYSKIFKEPFAPFLPGIRHITYNHKEDLSEIDEDTACVIMEPVQAEAGVVLPVDGYLEAVRKRCDETGSLLVFDEIQTGIGRTGTMFAFRQWGVTPDVIALGKALGGGLPLGAFAARAQIMDVLSYNPALGHITTFGGNPVCCAAGMAAMQQVQQRLSQQKAIKNNVQRNVSHISYIPNASEFIDHAAVTAVRQAGYLIGVQLPSADWVLKAVAEARNKGLLVDWFLFNPSAVRIAPPLVITDDELIGLYQILNRAIQHVSERHS